MSLESAKIDAVVVTYNRLNFLKEIINALRNQTKNLNNIIIVNNSSTDGTTEWLNEQKDIIVIKQENSGSSGGQYTGIKAAFDEGADWIWTMDDDVVPDLKCLELLSEKDDIKLVRAPLRYKPDGTPFFNDVIQYNITNPLKKFWQGIINEDYIKDKFIKVEGITFEGPLFHRTVVESIGLPEKNFFLFGDDTEYFLRVKEYGITIELCRDARLYRKLEFQTIHEISPLKKYYAVKNLIAINILHGSKPVRYIRPLIILLKEILRMRSISDLKYICKGFIQGYFYKSGN